MSQMLGLRIQKVKWPVLGREEAERGQLCLMWSQSLTVGQPELVGVNEGKKEHRKKILSGLRLGEECFILDGIGGFIHNCLQDLGPEMKHFFLPSGISAGEHSSLARRWSTFVFIFYWFICLEMKRRERMLLPVTAVLLFLLKKQKELGAQLNVGVMIESGERKRRGKCLLAF